MSQVAIRSIITTALATWAAAKPVPIPIARENQAFTPPVNNGTFITLTIHPTDTLTATLDGTRRRFLGEVVCNIWVKDGVGTGQAEALAEEIAHLFTPVPKTMLPVSIENWPSIKPSLLDDSGYRVTPVCFAYRAEY